MIFRPRIELILNPLKQLIQFREVLVMGTQAARQLPNTFRRVQVWAVGRQEVQTQLWAMFFEPGPQVTGVMAASIVDHHHHLASGPIPAQQVTEKGLKAYGVKPLCRLTGPAAVPGTNRSKERHTLAGGGVQYNRIDVLGRNPHGTA